MDNAPGVELPRQIFSQPRFQTSIQMVENNELQVRIQLGCVEINGQAATNLCRRISTGNADRDDGIPALADNDSDLLEILHAPAAANLAFAQYYESPFQVGLTAPGILPA